MLLLTYTFDLDLFCARHISQTPYNNAQFYLPRRHSLRIAEWTLGSFQIVAHQNTQELHSLYNLISTRLSLSDGLAQDWPCSRTMNNPEQSPNHHTSLSPIEYI